MASYYYLIFFPWCVSILHKVKEDKMDSKEDSCCFPKNVHRFLNKYILVYC